MENNPLFLFPIRSGEQTPSDDKRVRQGPHTNFLNGTEVSLKPWMKEALGEERNDGNGANVALSNDTEDAR